MEVVKNESENPASPSSDASAAPAATAPAAPVAAPAAPDPLEDKKRGIEALWGDLQAQASQVRVQIGSLQFNIYANKKQMEGLCGELEKLNNKAEELRNQHQQITQQQAAKK